MARPLQSHVRTLRSELTRYDFVMASFGGVVGSGWLFGAMYAAQDAGPSSIVAWVLGGLMVLVLALPYAELASAFPEPGAISRYPEMSHGSLVSLVTTVILIVNYALIPPIEAEATVRYLGTLVTGLYNHTSHLPTTEGLLLEVVLLCAYFTLNYFGVRLFAKANTLVTTFKIVTPLLTAGVLIVSGLGHSQANNFVAQGGFAPFGIHGILVAISGGGILFAYTGFRQAMDLSSEGRTPRRDVPYALIFVAVGSIVLYTLLAVAFIMALHPSQITLGWAHLNFNSPFAQLALTFNLGWLSTLLYVDAVVSPAGTGLTYTATTSRLLYAVPRNGYGPKQLSRVSNRGIPVIAQIITLGIGLVGLLEFKSWIVLAGILASTAVLAYSLGGVSMAVFRRTVPTMKRSFSLGAHGRWIAPVSFVVGALLVFWSGWPLVGEIDLVAVGAVIIWIYYYSKHLVPREDLHAGYWWIGFLAFMGVTSYLGSFGQGLAVLPFPLDTIVVICGSLPFYYWGVASGYPTANLAQYLHGQSEDISPTEQG